MTEDIALREEDHLILKQIQEGNDDVQKITSATTLENHQVTYSFQKLEGEDLIQISRPDKMVERVINGQKRVFQHPKTAELTDKGRKLIEESSQSDLSQYQDLSRQELVQRVHELDQRVDDLEQSFEIFRKQVQKLI